MGQKIFLGGLLLVADGWAKMPPPDGQGAVSELVSELRSSVSALGDEVKILTAEASRLRTDVDALKSKSAAFGEKQRGEVVEIVEDTLQKKNFSELIDREVNALSSAFSKAINELSEKCQSDLSRFRALFDAQQKGLDLLSNPPPKPRGSTHEVKDGETLDSIAAKHRVTRESLQESNFKLDENRLSPGQVIFIPAEK
jgi:LysM repeat protein